MNTDLQTLTLAHLRHALGHFATGVTVITTRSRDGRPDGTTVSAVSALSLDPPLVLVCLDRRSATLRAIAEQERFAVNVLGESQGALSDNFARPGDGAGWDDVVHRTHTTGVPHLDGALAIIECVVEQRIAGGDHEVLVGRVVEVEVGADGLRPLVHFRGGYVELAG